MEIAFSHVDAFTRQAFGGNPAVVCRVDAWPPDAWMRQVAGEMNAGATVFVRCSHDRKELRWFSPTVELEMCGHGTLAAAHILWEAGVADPAAPIAFHTRAGELGAVRDGDRIVLDFPMLVEHAALPPDGLLAALGIVDAGYVGRNRFDYLVEVEHEQTVRGLRPDMSALARIETRGVIVTSRAADPDVDFVSRFFAPATGIAEDHATGSAHCCLAVFWGRRLERTRLTARQLSPRGASFALELAGDRVRIGGEAVTVSDGRLTVTPSLHSSTVVTLLRGSGT
jgi:predicted PhzF superfamily epimerase YddE/YHI9